MGVKLAVHQQDIIALVPCCLDERILGLGVSGIEEDYLLVLVSLGPFYGLPVIVYAEILAVSVLQQAELHRPLAELLVA